MKTFKHRGWLIALGVLVIISLGWLRETVFNNLNHVLYFKNEGEAVGYEVPYLLSFLEDLTANQLYYGKYICTVLFAAFYIGFTVAMIAIIFPGRQYLIWTLKTLGVLVGLSFLLFGVGWALSALGHAFDWWGYGPWEKCYRVAHKIMHIIQSPLILMALVMGFLLLKQTRKSNPEPKA